MGSLLSYCVYYCSEHVQLQRNRNDVSLKKLHARNAKSRLLGGRSIVLVARGHAGRSRASSVGTKCRGTTSFLLTIQCHHRDRQDNKQAKDERDWRYGTVLYSSGGTILLLVWQYVLIPMLLFQPLVEAGTRAAPTETQNTTNNNAPSTLDAER